jgi:folate-binding protein YgfZ
LADGSDAFWIDVGPASAAEFLRHLDHFLISEDVSFTERTRELVLFHVAGPGAAALEPGFRESLGGGTAILRQLSRLSVPGWDLLCPAESAATVRQWLADAGVQPAGQDVFEVLRVEAGMPAHGKEIDDTRLAMELGRTAQAINYTKGCYLGQETIVMARDRGHVNRMLLGLKLAGDEPAAAGAKVIRGEEEVGQVTSSVFSPRVGAAIALAFLRRGHQQPGTAMEVESVKGKRAAEIAALPFSV